jgi:hypothetical protein
MEPTENPTEMDFAKMAVIIDCEANISITTDRNHRYYTLQVTLGSCDFALLEWCQTRFGGFRCGHYYHKIPPRTLPSKRWKIAGHDAAALLQRCLRHFIIKREQAQVAIDFQATFGARGSRLPVTEELRRQREQLKLRLESLTL